MPLPRGRRAVREGHQEESQRSDVARGGRASGRRDPRRAEAKGPWAPAKEQGAATSPEDHLEVRVRPAPRPPLHLYLRPLPCGGGREL